MRHCIRSRSIRWSVLLVLCLGLGQTSAQRRKPVEDYRELKYPPLRPIQVPEPDRFTLPNGMRVFLVADHELPLIEASVLVRVGSRWEPIEKAGLASLVGEVMRTGGTPQHPGDALDEELDRLGAVIETSIGQNSGGASLSVLREDINRGLEILADLLQHPAFPEDKIELAKIAMRDAIARRNDDPQSVAYREFYRVLYGTNTAYGHQPEYATLKAIRREDLVEFHRRFFQPENVILGVWGDFEVAGMRERIERMFGDWPRGGHPQPPVPQVTCEPKSVAGLYLVEKPELNQSWVLMGHLDGRHDDPDFYALTLMNRILGSGFASRLFSNVRTKQGLAYAVGSTWNAGWDVPGYFRAGGHSKSESTLALLEAIKREIVNLQQNGVSEDEVSRVKDATLKGFAFEFDSTGEIVQRLMQYEYFGYPLDYLQRYQENIAKVTRAEVEAAARKHLKPEQFAILVLGNPKAFEKPLDSLGPVKLIDISIPKPE